MRIEARIIKRYCFRDHYAFLVMEAPGMREELLLYIQADSRDEAVFVRRLSGCTLDDTERHLREIEALADQAVKLYEEACGTVPVTRMASSELPASPAKAGVQTSSTRREVSGESIPAEKPRSAGTARAGESHAAGRFSGTPAGTAESSGTVRKPAAPKRFRSAEEEEREKARSLAMLQKNSLIDYRYNRQGKAVKQMLEGSGEALVSDIFSVIELVNRRMADDIRPLLLSMLPYYHNSDFDTEYQLARDKETTIRYVVNENGLITACTVNGGRYPLCLAILMILRQLAEQSEEGIDAFHERIMARMEKG